jgi:hypothetical protein
MENMHNINYTTNERNFYTPEEVRQKVFADTISKPLLYAAIKRGEIASMRLGRKILVPAWWVDRILSMPEEEGMQIKK